MSNAATAGLVLEPGNGVDVSRRNGREVIIKAAASDTEGRLSIHEAAHPPDVLGPPVHVHRQCDETFYVLAGRLRVLIGETEHTLAPGGFALVPRGTPHTFITDSDRPARFLVTFAPAGFEGFLVDVADVEREQGQELGPAELQAIASRYDWQIVGPPLRPADHGGRQNPPPDRTAS